MRTGCISDRLSHLEDNVYIANTGDSRGIISMNNGNNIVNLTNDHRPSNISEEKRIYKYGGKIYKLFN